MGYFIFLPNQPPDRRVAPVTGPGEQMREFRGVNRTLRTVSALMRHTWAIEPVWADQHMPLVTDYLAGKISREVLLDQAEQNRPIGYVTGPDGVAVPLLVAEGGGDEQTWSGSPYANPNLPEGSVAVLDVRGAIMKEGTCCSYGTEDYCRMMEDIYANDRIIGAVIMMDSPGGQLSGTPSVFDMTRRADKPCVGHINEGLAASAALWWLAGCDYIQASQKTDQVGSIGVFVRMRDTSAQLEKAGIRELSVYSDLSPDKNKPYRDALKGDTKALREDLNVAATHFREAVVLGRGDRLNAAAGDPFTGKVYYATEAIKLGLIDGIGTLPDAVAKVRQLSAERAGVVGTSRLAEATSTTDSFSTGHQADSTVAGAEQPGNNAPELTSDQSTPNLNPNPSTGMPFGYQKVTALMAVAGLAADQVTQAHVDAINSEIADLGIEQITAVTNAQFAQSLKDASAVSSLTTELATANTQIATLTRERDEARSQARAFGDQPGSVASRAQKTEETTAGADSDEVISDTDAELRRMKAALKPTAAR